MKTRRGIRGTIKWGGAVVTVLLLIVWVGSASYRGGFIIGKVVLYFDAGSVVITNSSQPHLYWTFKYGSSGPFRWWIFYRQNAGGGGEAVGIPTWIPLLLTAVPTFLIWRHDRKRPPGICRKCGYSRTGLPADRACPECGTSPVTA
jgi:hypothetical protein